MSELFREIQEDLRQERLSKLWGTFGKTAVAVSAAVILATIGVVVVQGYVREQSAKRTALMLQGDEQLDSGDYKGAAEIYGRLAGDSDAGYYGVVMLRLARTQESGGDKDAALKTYQALAGSDSSLASLGALAQAKRSGEPVQAERTSPFYYSLREWNGWEKLEQGKKKEAVDDFLALRNEPEAPYTMKQRMQEVLMHIAPEALASADPKEKATLHE